MIQGIESYTAKKQNTKSTYQNEKFSKEKLYALKLKRNQKFLRETDLTSKTIGFKIISKNLDLKRRS
jgi:hypothetical protein